MSRFLKNLVLFFILILMVDIGYGLISNYLFWHAHSGIIQKRVYVSNEVDKDIVMFGSSRMAHHYVTNIIQDSLDVTCYNAGEDGQGIFLSYYYLQSLLNRYKPKLIVYDIYRFDIETDDNTKYISVLKPFSRNDAAKEVITSISPLETLKLKSSLYKYNSMTFNILESYLLKEKTDSNNGFQPFTKHFNRDIDLLGDNGNKKEYSIDSLKLLYLMKFISICKENEIPLLFFISPAYKPEHVQSFTVIKELLQSEGVMLYDFYEDQDYALHKELFQDWSHMNYNGAVRYTNKLIPYLKRVVNYNRYEDSSI